MSNCPHPATLLVFTLGERHESRRRRLLPTHCQPLEQRFHRACLEVALDAGRALGLNLEVSSPERLDLPADVRHRRQEGRGFGPRLERSLGRALNRGGPVVLVGSDVPGLDAGHLRAAVEPLHDDPNRVVLGPAADGGIYLLATGQPLGAALDGVRWCCADTLESLCQALERAGRSVVLLPTLEDLDDRADLAQWLARHRRSRRRFAPDLDSLYVELRSALVSAQPRADRGCPRSRRRPFLDLLPRRGPPTPLRPSLVPFPS